MITRPIPRAAAAVAIALSALLATACAGAPPAAAPTDSAAPAPTSPSPTPSAGTATTSDATPTCDTIIPASVVANFTEVGWTVHAETLRINGVEIADGLECTWGDFTTATDHVQIFGWAPISADAAATAQSELLASGWSRSDSAEGIYITESPSTAIATDDQGFGLTYLFGDGWVKYADTKQGLLLVQWPKD